jgi:uncharacterized cysteine cluster protein YcgN (CxxCxxCC family)
MTDLAECTNCAVQGACCRFTVAVEERVRIYSSYSCPHLLDNGLCGNYEKRQEVPWCSAIDEASIDWPRICAHHTAEQSHLLNAGEYIMLKGGTADQHRDLKRMVDAAAKEEFMQNYGQDITKLKSDT